MFLSPFISFKHFSDAAIRFDNAFPRSVAGKLDVYSGDGWQMLMPNWRFSLRAALFLRAVVKTEKQLKLDSRVAIAWGHVDESSVNPERVSESTGDAFTQSGRALREVESGSCMALRNIEKSGVTDAEIMASSVGLLDFIVQRWKPAQADAVSWIILGMKQETIAERLGVSQPTVHSAIKSAGWYPIEQFLKQAERIGQKGYKG